VRPIGFAAAAIKRRRRCLVRSSVRVVEGMAGQRRLEFSEIGPRLHRLPAHPELRRRLESRFSSRSATTADEIARS